MDLRGILGTTLALLSLTAVPLAQPPAQPSSAAPSAVVTQAAAAAASAQTPTLTTRSSLVLVPALVRNRNKAGELVFGLPVTDFTLTDDGIPQKLRLEEDTGGEPLALVIVIEGGGAGEQELRKYQALGAMLGSIVGAVPHRIAVVGYDSSPVLVQDFTADSDVAAKGIDALIQDDNGDDGAATLDSLVFAIDLLRRQPIQYRRAVLLLSEARDRGSKATLDDALKAISDTNTAIYSIGFSSLGHDTGGHAAKLSSSQPGPAHGCFSRDPNDPNVDLTKNVATQSFDCLAMLAPPLRLATVAFVAARDALARNIPESVARLTGGEFFKLGSEKNLERDLETISNHIPNRYVLSFQPNDPHAGFHTITLALPGFPHLAVFARNGYWAEAPPAAPPPPAQNKPRPRHSTRQVTPDTP